MHPTDKQTHVDKGIAQDFSSALDYVFVDSLYKAYPTLIGGSPKNEADVERKNGAVSALYMSNIFASEVKTKSAFKLSTAQTVAFDKVFGEF